MQKCQSIHIRRNGHSRLDQQPINDILDLQQKGVRIAEDILCLKRRIINTIFQSIAPFAPFALFAFFALFNLAGDLVPVRL